MSRYSYAEAVTVFTFELCWVVKEKFENEIFSLRNLNWTKLMNEYVHMNASEFTLCDMQLSFRITGFEKSQGNYKWIKTKKE